jgi:hypothetical protein
VKHSCDGSTRDLYLFPTQIGEINNEIKRMYGVFGIEYHTPVYDFDIPRDDIWGKMGIISKKDARTGSKSNATGALLFKYGLIPSIDEYAIGDRRKSRLFKLMEY